MTESIKNLLALAAEFPTRKRVNYDDDADRIFVSKVLKAVARAHRDMADPAHWAVTPEQLTQAAAAAMRDIKPTVAAIATNLRFKAQEERERKEGSILAAFALEGAAADLESEYDLSPQTGLTIQSPAPAGASSPSNAASPGQPAEPSTRTPAATPNTAGTAAAPGQTAGTSGTPASLPAKLVAARKAAAKRKTPSSKAPARKPIQRACVSPLAPPPATDGSAQP